jgi:hypothetical protein
MLEDAMIAAGDRSPGKGQGSRREAAAVQCIVCGEGIFRVEDLALTDSGPVHLTCRAGEPPHRSPCAAAS